MLTLSLLLFTPAATQTATMSYHPSDTDYVEGGQYAQGQGQPVYGQPAQQYAAPSYASPQPQGYAQQGYAHQEGYAQEYPPPVLLHGDAEYASNKGVAGGGDGFASIHPDGSASSNEGFVQPGGFGGKPGGGFSDLSANGGGDVVAPSSAGGGYRDLAFLIAFALHIVFFLILAFVYGPALVRDINHRNAEPTPTNPDNQRKQTSDQMMIGVLGSLRTHANC